jgi:DMSO/TMAO reductase YedYZ molybdopterin-dependent catalytic subunit
MRRVLALALAGALTALGLVALAAACGGSSGGQASPAVQASPSVSPSGPVVLTLVGETGQKQFTIDQLQALPAYSGYAGIKSSTGVITLPAEYTGVRLSDLTALVGGISRANGVTLVAKDGYGMTFSYAQIMEHAFTAYDPATGAEQTPSKDLTVVIAYAREGKPLGVDPA